MSRHTNGQHEDFFAIFFLAAENGAFVKRLAKRITVIAKPGKVISIIFAFKRVVKTPRKAIILFKHGRRNNRTSGHRARGRLDIKQCAIGHERNLFHGTFDPENKAIDLDFYRNKAFNYQRSRFQIPFKKCLQMKSSSSAADYFLCVVPLSHTKL